MRSWAMGMTGSLLGSHRRGAVRPPCVGGRNPPSSPQLIFTRLRGKNPTDCSKSNCPIVNNPAGFPPNPNSLGEEWMPAGVTARARNGAKARSGPDRRARARTRRSQEFDTELFLTTVGVGRTIATYRAKSYIFRQGTKCNAVYYIQQGHIELS